jgi:(E)-4-hydroxy-3-methylbut-2-enyl-diphosphate synthase
MADTLYCPSLTEYRRWLTREVPIGDCPLGGSHPIRVQSMTTTDTLDVKATVAQSIRIIEAGADYVRITAPSIKHAEALEPIKKAIRNAGFSTPVVADIHFTPNAAELAARLVEKVRVNPGNYADKKKFEQIEYSDAEYQSEIDRIRQRFTPLVRICKEYGTAMRIGTNHGSLSDRIMSRYGDTPLGMVESAMEFVRVCEDEGFYDIVLSMKASNPLVMVQAYRLLVQHQVETGRNYPLHLGVTEAGEGVDGRIKSAVGIGTLLEDGLGDTIRVSLTEEPEVEVPVAQALVDRYVTRRNHAFIEPISRPPKDMLSYGRRETIEVSNIGGLNVPIVVGHPAAEASAPLPDYLPADIPGSDLSVFGSSGFDVVSLDTSELTADRVDQLRDSAGQVIVLSTENPHGMADLRRSIFTLIAAGVRTPVVVKRTYADVDHDKLMLYAATDLGALLLDGLIDGIWIEAPLAPVDILDTAFAILQATRTRITRTDFISCPSCGRTLFDLQVTSAMIREKTDHLKGLKIAIMGCIVNGPGEMADADYGYVGSGPGKVSLYKGKEIVKRNVPTGEALDELINVIKQSGDWVEVEAETADVL